MTESEPVDVLRVGMRAVVRHRIEHGVTDALGYVLAIDADTVTVQTRRGVTKVARAAVVAAKEVPPPPSRRGAPHLAISMEELERIMVQGWQPVESAELGDWLLRASAGFTGRANSVLPLGNPGVPLSEAVDRAEKWYDERGLRRVFSLFGPTGFTIDDDSLGRELLRRGYEPFNNSVVLTADTTVLAPEVPHLPGARVRLESSLSPSWWEAWVAWDARFAPAEEADVPPAVARAVLSGSPEQLFASVEVGEALIGVARIAFAQDWAGVSALHVAPDHRRVGVALQIMGALADASRTRGIPSMYLQVARANSAAWRLYERLGFSIHHEYLYLGQ